MATDLVQRLQLAISTTAILKEGVVAGWTIVQSTASQWNGPLFFLFFVFVFLFFVFVFCFLFCFVLFCFVLFCFVLLCFVLFCKSPGTGRKLVSERTTMVNKMKN